MRSAQLLVEDSEGDCRAFAVKKKVLKSYTKHKTRINFYDFVNAVHNCERGSQFCERRSQFRIVNVAATPRNNERMQFLNFSKSNFERRSRILGTLRSPPPTIIAEIGHF